MGAARRQLRRPIDSNRDRGAAERSPARVATPEQGPGPRAALIVRL